jgi:hypothetical protein
MRIRPFLLVLLVLSCVPASLGSAHAASSVSLKSLALKRSDLPKGFKQTKAAFVSNKVAASRDRLSLSDLRRHGRIAAYESTFGGALSGQLASAQDAIVQYRSAAGAHWDFMLHVQRLRKQAATIPRMSRVLRASSVGGERYALAVQLSKPSKSAATLTDYIVVFRRGAYVTVVVLVAGGTTQQSTAIRLAHIIDQRIQSAG